MALLWLLLVLSEELMSQSKNYYLSGVKKGELDTIGLEISQKVVKEASGLLEKEIEAENYIIGPNDIFIISIISSKSYEYECIVSPEGKIVIPNVGAVELKGKTLSGGEKLIKEKVRKRYNTDEVYVTLSELRKFKVTVAGHVRHPDIVSATAVDRASEVIAKAGGLLDDASLRNIVLIRDKKRFNVDLIGYFNAGDKMSNPTVLGGDQIIVTRLDTQNVIGIYGEVSSPGLYEYRAGDSLSSLFKFALGFSSTALLDSVEIARYISSEQMEKWVLNLSSWETLFFTGEPLPFDIPLSSGDRVYVRKKTIWPNPQTVAITGEVIYPGYYSVKEDNERISDLIARAGGFTKNASLESAILIRQKELKIEDKEMDRLWRIPPSEMSESELKYFQARVRERKGLMSINFNKIIHNPDVDDNILLEDQDSLFIPPKKLFINVQGRVNNPGLIVFNPNYNYLDYIALAGGFGYRADETETMIVKSKGELFLAESKNYTLEAGDNILVPPEEEISTWKIITEALLVTTQVISIVGVIIALVRL